MTFGEPLLHLKLSLRQNSSFLLTHLYRCTKQRPTAPTLLAFVIFKIVIDPQGRPTVIDHCFCKCRPSFPTFQNKTNFNRKQCSLLGETVDLAEWIIDDTCLVASVLCVLRSCTCCIAEGLRFYEMHPRLLT